MIYAAIIGYWRNGMTHDEIARVVGLDPAAIDSIIWVYKNTKK
jgi:uncharacterized protein (DUF433 family)